MFGYAFHCEADNFKLFFVHSYMVPKGLSDTHLGILTIQYNIQDLARDINSLFDWHPIQILWQFFILWRQPESFLLWACFFNLDGTPCLAIDLNRQNNSGFLQVSRISLQIKRTRNEDEGWLWSCTNCLFSLMHYCLLHFPGYLTKKMWIKTFLQLCLTIFMVMNYLHESWLIIILRNSSSNKGHKYNSNEGLIGNS